MSQDTVTKRALLMDLLENYKEIDDIDFDTIKNMDCMELHEKIEKRKMHCRMTKAAIIL